MPIVEITARCDLACPVCLAGAGRDWDMPAGDFRRVLDGLIRAEWQVDILTLSGGEPLVHPHILDLVDEVASRPQIVRTSISTNGLALLRDPALLPALARRNVVISLQRDGLDDGAYTKLRGRPLLAEKLRILDLLAESQVATSLTVTLAGGVNERELGPIAEYFFAHRHVVSLMIQPVAFVGRAEGMAGGADRLTIPDVIRLLAETGHMAAADFAPLPCSHPLCFSLAYYLALDGGGRGGARRRVPQPLRRGRVAVKAPQPGRPGDHPGRHPRRGGHRHRLGPPAHADGLHQHPSPRDGQDVRDCQLPRGHPPGSGRRRSPCSRRAQVREPQRRGRAVSAPGGLNRRRAAGLKIAS
jgi:pyruvate-formate lyase-activating enzyme